MLLGSCGGAGDNQRVGDVRIDGRLGEGYSVNSSEKADSRSLSSAVTHIGAFSVIAGSIEELSTAVVDEEGVFSLDVENNLYFTPFTTVYKTDWEGNYDRVMFSFNMGSNVPPEYAEGLPDDQFILGYGDVPEGDWILSIDDDESILAAYDYSLLDPMGENGYPIILIPSVQYEFTGSELTAFKLRFMYIDRDGIGYEADAQAVRRILDKMMFAMAAESLVFSGNPEEYLDGYIFTIPLSALSEYGFGNRQVELQYDVLSVRVRFNYYF